MEEKQKELSGEIKEIKIHSSNKRLKSIFVHVFSDFEQSTTVQMFIIHSVWDACVWDRGVAAVAV